MISSRCDAGATRSCCTDRQAIADADAQVVEQPGAMASFVEDPDRVAEDDGVAHHGRLTRKENTPVSNASCICLQSASAFLLMNMPSMTSPSSSGTRLSTIVLPLLASSSISRCARVQCHRLFAGVEVAPHATTWVCGRPSTTFAHAVWVLARTQLLGRPTVRLWQYRSPSRCPGIWRSAFLDGLLLVSLRLQSGTA